MRWNLFSVLLVAASAGIGIETVDANDSCVTSGCSTASGCNASGGCQSGACDSGSACCNSGCRGCRACRGSDPGCGPGGCHGLHSHGYCLARGYPGLDRYFNCGCNGSYKFPVPPLYTYHWPGMYSQQLMTDYHSPWRFPPIKPYSDEQLQPYSGMGPAPEEALPPSPPAMSRTHARNPSNIQTADYSSSPKVVPGSAESMSVKLKRSSQYLPQLP